MPQEQNTPSCVYCTDVCLVGFGFCHCGCKEKTNLADRNIFGKRFQVKGKPLKFKKMHAGNRKAPAILPDENLCICQNGDCQIPYGMCHCGCGEESKISDKTSITKFIIKGKPMRFIVDHGHYIKPTIENAKPFKIDGVYCRLVPLTRGFFTIIDAVDYVWIMQHKWHVKFAEEERFYAARLNRGTEIALHRAILDLKTDNPKFGDHKNGNTLDNRRLNLREADFSQSSQNTKARKNRSGYKGVTFYPELGLYRARVVLHGKQHDLGYYKSALAAHMAYQSKASELFGEYARFS